MAPSAWPPGRVLDLTRLLPGPLAGKLLLGLGFPVLKVEPPGGDPLKALAPEAYAFLNEGKEVLSLDLKAEEGRGRLLALARESALLLESNRPGVMERLGLGPEVLLAENPRLVYVRLRGYPDTPDPGHDLTYLAEAGLLGLFPWQAFQFADLAGAYALALTALKGLLLGGGFYEVALSEAVKALAYPPIPFLDGSVLCYRGLSCQGREGSPGGPRGPPLGPLLREGGPSRTPPCGLQPGPGGEPRLPEASPPLPGGNRRGLGGLG